MIKLSVIIATYNRAENLRRTLESLACQTADDAVFEIVAVNNNSADNTPEVGREFAAMHPGLNFSMVSESKQGLSHARNCGIENSNGEYIAVIDDDEEVNAEFVESYILFFDAHPDVSGAGGKIVPLYEYEPPRWLTPYTERPIAGQLDLGPDVRPFKDGSYPGGGNMAVRRSALERIGVFDPNLGRNGSSPMGGEEKDLFVRLRAAGGKIYYLPGAIIYHIIPRSKFEDGYFDRLTRMVGASERVRTRSVSGGAYFKALLKEAVKWCGTLVLASGYQLRGESSKGRYLIRMRRNITQGLLGKSS